MKKLSLLISLGLVMTTLCACNQSKTQFDDIVAKVNGEKIYRNVIEHEVELSAIAHQDAVDYINSTDSLTEVQKTIEFEKLGSPKTFDEALQEEIELTVLLCHAEKEGLKVDFDGAREEATAVYNDLFNSDTSNDGNEQTAKLVKKYMEENNLSKKEYIKYLSNIYYRNAMINKLKEHFNDELFNPKSKESFDQQFSKYTEQLVEDAKIEYKN